MPDGLPNDAEWQELWWGSDRCDECGQTLVDGDLVLWYDDGEREEVYCEDCGADA